MIGQEKVICSPLPTQLPFSASNFLEHLLHQQLLVMEKDRSRQQDPEKLEKEEMPSTNSTQLMDLSLQRDEDHQQEDHPCDLEKIIPGIQSSNLNICDFIDLNSRVNDPKNYFPAQLLHFQTKSTNQSDKNLNFYLIPNPLYSHYFFVHPDQETSNSTILPTADIQDFLGAEYSGNFRQKWLKYSSKKQINCCETIEIFNEIMTSGLNVKSIEAVSAGQVLQSVIEYYHKEYESKEKQYAVAVIFLKNGKHVFFPAVQPDFKEHKHSEEILSENIDKLLHENKSMEIECILIYTFNSPCLKRPKKNTMPCMFLLLCKATQWQRKYGFSTYVVFTEFWGLCGPRFYEEPKDSSVLCYMSDVSIRLDFIIKICKQNGNSCDEKPKTIKVIDKKQLCNAIEPYLRDGSHITPEESKDQICQPSTKEKKRKIDESKDQIHQPSTKKKRKKDVVTPDESKDQIHQPSTKKKRKKDVVTPDESKDQICETFSKEKKKEIQKPFNFAAFNLFVADLKSHWGDRCPLQIFQLRSVNKIM